MPVALVIEEIAEMRRLFAELLNDLGCEVLAAETAQEGQDLARHSDRFALVIASQQPGDPERQQAILAIVAVHPEARLLVTSGYQLAESELPPGAVFLPKPFRPADFAARVRELLGR